LASYGGLKASSTPLNVVVACDMPFVNPAVLRHLIRLAEASNVEAVVPVINGKPQPTICRIQRTCLDHIRRLLDEGQTSPLRLIEKVRSLLVTQEGIEQVDPSLVSFLNVNTKRDLSRARRLACDVEPTPK
jgi:molybdopterin-guanine dinucleotide biosynthesis protein A